MRKNLLLALIISLMVTLPSVAFSAVPHVAGGGSHTLMIKTDGSLWGWGLNQYGQLGDGSTFNRAAPTRIGTATNWSSVTAGTDFSVAIQSDGTMWAWGNNSTGQLGYSTAPATLNQVPQKIGTSTNWTSVSAGPDYTMAIQADGTLWAWGVNGVGKLGDGSTANSPTPKKIGTATDWALVSAGVQHTLALKKDGTLWAWGNNGESRLGDGTTTSSLIPKKIGTDTSWVSIVAGLDYSFGVKSDGSLWAWGNNSNGRLGAVGNATTPTNTYTPSGWLKLFGGGVSEHVIALKSDGRLYAWGNNWEDQLGLGNNEYSTFKPDYTLINDDTNWAAASTGASHTVALKLNGSVYSWGANSTSQLGYWTDNSANQKYPFLVTPLNLAGGANHSLAVAPDGTLWSWGRNLEGQLGLGNQVNSSQYPQQIDSSSNWIAVAAGTDFSLAIKSDGTLWQWGKNIGSYGNTYTPTKVGSDNNWAEVSAGFDHALALKTNGSMWAWGENTLGQLGDYLSHATPYQIGNTGMNIGAVWSNITAGTKFSGAIRSNGTMWTWGDNSCDQGGTGPSGGFRSYLTQVNGDTNWQNIAAGECHMLASKANGNYAVYAWGLNDLDQLGLGPGASSPISSPTSITSLFFLQGNIRVQAGLKHSLALNQSGDLYGWGDSPGYGTSRNTPTQISGEWAAIAAGGSHSLGQKLDGGLYAWGNNNNGQLGTGYSSASSPTPVNSLPVLSNFVSASNNVKSSGWAKIGDTVTLTFSSDIHIPQPVITIAGQPATVNGTGTSWTATRVMTAQNSEGSVDYNIRYTNSLNGSSTNKQGYTGITFDRTPPTADAISNNTPIKTAPRNQGTNVFLYGAGFDSASTPSCSWSQISGPASAISFQNATSCSGTWMGTSTDGNYILRLMVSDQAGNSAYSDYGFLWDSTAPTLTTVHIASSNAGNPGYARAGENIVISFTTSEPINTPTVTFFDVANANISGSSSNWTAQISTNALSSISASTAAFKIYASDIAGNSPPTPVQSTTDSSSVYVDKTIPSLSGINLVSSNANASTAKSGDTVTLTFLASENILTPTVSIAGHPVTPLKTFLTNNWTASHAMTAQDAEGDVTFRIEAVSDPAKNISAGAATSTTNASKVTYDRTAPTISIGTPIANFMETTAPTDISGTAFDNITTSKVEVQVSTTLADANFLCMYMDATTLTYGICPSNPAPWVTIPSQKGSLGSAVNGTSTWSLNVNNLFSSNTTYSINARAFDSAGNISTTVTSNFTRVATLYGTKLYATPLSTVLLANGTTTVQGQLTLQDSTKTISLSNQMITVSVKDAITGNPVSGSPFSGTTTDTAGHFSINGIGGIVLPGNYKLQAHFTSAVNGGTGLSPSDSPEYTITVGSQPGYAIIVQGRITTGEGLQAHARTANRIYKTLKDRGFQASNIRYIGPSITNLDPATAIGVSLESTPASSQAIQDAIAWAKGQMISSPAPFYLIMVDHGVNGVFRIDSGNTVVNITPQTLNSWLAVLDTDLTTAAQKQVIMIGSCYSGSFIDSLKREGRVVITSAAANEESYKGSLEQPDGVRSGEYFLDAMFHELKIGYSLTSAFRTAAAKTRDFTRKGWDMSSNSLYGDNSVQHPLLDDTGDGIAVNQISDQSGDGSMAASMYLGIGDTRTNAVDPGEILSVTSTRTLVNENSYPIWLQHSVSLQGDNAVSAWAEIRKPDLVIPSQQNQVTEQVALTLDTVPLTISSDMATGTCSSTGNCSLFSTSGKYEIFYYTRKQSGAISEVRRSVIYKKDASGTAPLAFNLKTPANANIAQMTNGIVFSWNPTTDGDSNHSLRTPVTYTLEVCSTPDFTSGSNVFYAKFEELTDTFAKLDESDGIVDGKQYFWRATATDLYGNATATSVWNFTVNNNTNAPTLYFYKGTVLDADTKIPLSGVTVTSSAASWTTITNGRYLVFSDLTEPSDITASYPGYKDATISVEPIFSTSGTNYVDNTFYLVSNTPILTLNFGGNGEGSVNGDISCIKGGSCPPVQLVADSPITLTPAPVTTNSVFSGWSGACTNPTGICTFTMNGAKTVTAAFSLAPKIKLDLNATSGYDIFADAYSNSSANLYSMNSILVENWSLAGGKTITLNGGYQADYQARTGYTVLNGKLSIKSGKLQVDGLKVR